MTVIIDYDAGNIKSVTNALKRMGAEYCLSADPEIIRNAGRVILPGVGNASQAMKDIRRKDLAEIIRGLRVPVLGICVGMQILCRDSEEGGSVECLGVFDSHVKHFPANVQAKVPHMGWNQIGNLDSKLFKGVKGGQDVYFVHSYYPTLCADTIASCKHGEVMFSAALKYENFYGTQFHPEKSGNVGETILANFLAL